MGEKNRAFEYVRKDQVVRVVEAVLSNAWAGTLEHKNLGFALDSVQKLPKISVDLPLKRLKRRIEEVETSIRANLLNAERYRKDFKEYPLGISTKDVLLLEKTLKVMKDVKNMFFSEDMKHALCSEDFERSDISPEEFCDRMSKLAEIGDKEASHSKMDDLLLETLDAIGYSGGVSVFKNAEKYYS